MRTRTSVLRLAVFRCLTRDGMHQRGVQARLNLPKTTVQRTVRFLLEIGAIEPHGAPPSARTITFYRRGPKAAQFEAGPSGPGGPGVAPPKPVLAGGALRTRPGLVVGPHRGTVKLAAYGLPVDPTSLPGYSRPSKPSGAAHWYYRFQASDGNLWSAQLSAHKGGKTGTLLVTPPEVLTRDLEAALDDAGWKAAAQKEAIAWGQRYGLDLTRDRAGPVQVQPREYAIPLPGIGLKPEGTPGVSRVFTDGSHPNAIETQDPSVVRAVATLPEDMQAALAHVRRMEQEHPQLREIARHVVALLEETLATQGVVVRGLAAVSALNGQPLPSSLPSSHAKPGVEIQ